MRLIQLVVCFSAVSSRICFAGLIGDNAKTDKSLVEATIDILESCYADRIGTVGLAGPSIERIIEAISLGDTVIPITLIDETSRVVGHDPVNSLTRYKLQVFVVTATNSSSLVKTLIELKNSKWWNHMASFILIGWPKVENGCSEAYELLWEAWKMNLLNSKFVCLHQIRGRLIYTFNPYTSKAPVPWQQENTYKGINGHEWTLFVREYREDKSPCGALDFDKTLDLGGYEVRASVKGSASRQSPDPSPKPIILDRVQHITNQILITSLNGTWKFVEHAPNKRPPQDGKGNPSGWSVEVINGSTDIGLTILVHHAWANYDSTYPYFEVIPAIITQYPGHKSQLDKLISVLDRRSRFCVLVVLLITLLFFKCYVRQPSISAILTLVLLICNAALRKIPRKLAPRIYLGSLFLLVVTIHGIYQGKFASLLTKQKRLPAVNTIDDLARSGHTIYGLDYWHSFFNYSTFEGRYVEILEYNCTGYVLRDSRAACFSTKNKLTDDAVEFKLHLSRESIGTSYGVLLVRPDWPLKDRVNSIYERAFAGDVLRPLYTREFNGLINKLESYEKQDEDQGFEPLTLDELGFAFVVLAIGLGCAFISFIIEVIIYDTPAARLHSRIRRRITWIP